jgi:hypothetical protein
VFPLMFIGGIALLALLAASGRKTSESSKKEPAPPQLLPGAPVVIDQGMASDAPQNGALITTTADDPRIDEMVIDYVVNRLGLENFRVLERLEQASGAPPRFSVEVVGVGAQGPARRPLEPQKLANGIVRDVATEADRTVVRVRYVDLPGVMLPDGTYPFAQPYGPTMVIFEPLAYTPDGGFYDYRLTAADAIPLAAWVK